MRSVGRASTPAVSCGIIAPEWLRVARRVGAMFNMIRERTGIYGLGFRKESVMGVILPIAFVVIVGGAIAALIVLR